MPFTVILSSTIHVNNCSFLERKDPKDRIADYQQSLQLWLDKSDFRIVFVENSQADLSPFLPFREKYPNRIEFLSFDGNNFPRHYGKGFGEQLTINYAIDNSNFIKECDYIFKISGRYFLSELPKAFENFNHNLYDAAIYTSKEYPDGGACVFFYLKKAIYERFMRNAPINDSNGLYYEHTLQNTIKNIQSERIFKVEKMGILGISGTANKVVTWMS